MARKRKGEVDHDALETAVLAHLVERDGRRPKWSKVLDNFPEISRTTLFRARDEVLKRRPEFNRALGYRSSPRMDLPPPPTHQDLQEAPVVEPVAQEIRIGMGASLLGLWRENLAHADQVLEYYGPQQKGGEPRKARYYLDALVIRDRIVANMLKATTQIYTSMLVQRLCDKILRNLKDRDPAFANLVLDDIRRAYEEAGLDVSHLRV